MNSGEIPALVAFFLFAVVVLPVILRSRGERRKRELEHIERMRAIEVGRAFPGDVRFALSNIPNWIVPHVVAVAVGAVVPIGVFVFAFLASLVVGYHREIWIAAGMVGLGAVIGGTVLRGRRSRKCHRTARAEEAGPYWNSKPNVEEDAYDVVSSRG